MSNWRVLALSLAASGLIGSATCAGAQVPYAHPDAPIDFFSPYDESYGTSPSFEVYPNAYGSAPAVRVVQHCQYPDGWNVTDFSRDVNGIPNGLDHICPAPVYRGRARARY